MDIQQYAGDRQLQAATGFTAFGALVEIAEQYGWTRQWVVNAMQEAGNDIKRVLARMGSGARRDFEAWVDDNRQAVTEFVQDTGNQLSNAAQNLVPKSGKRLRTGEMKEPSLENTPASTEVMEDNDGGGNMGMENDIVQEGPVWTHFPNTQDCYLQWRETFYYVDQAKVIDNRQVFGNPAWFAATSYATTGGGVPVGTTTENLLDVTAGNCYDFNLPWILQLRMTTPYTIVQTIGATGANTSKSEPNWLQYFDQKYQYYHQIQCDYKVTLNFGTPSLAGAIYANYENYGIWVFYRYTNRDNPPTQWTYTASETVARSAQATADSIVAGAADTGTSVDTIAQTLATAGSTNTYNLTSDDYMRMGGWKKKYVSFNQNSSSSCVITGSYKFGQCKMDVKTLEQQTVGTFSSSGTEEWAPTGSTAIFPENLTIIAVQDCARSGAAGKVIVPFSISCSTGHRLVFKDIRQNYKFPHPGLVDNQGVVNLTGDEINFFRGAGSN